MPRFPLQSLLEHSRHRKEAAERLLRMLKRKEGEARQRLEQLQGFRGEYQARLSRSSSAGMSIMQFRDYQVFMAKIDAAVLQQEREVSEAHARWELAHRQWLAQRQKVDAYEVLAARHRSQEAQRLERREQKANDELAGKSGAQGDLGDKGDLA